MNHKIWPILITSLLLLPLGAAADDSVRSIETCKSYQVGFGTTRLLDTYLSQQAFAGGGLSFLTTSETRRNDSVPSAWHTLIEHQASLSLTNDKSELREELQGDYSLYVGRLYGKRLALGATVSSTCKPEASSGPTSASSTTPATPTIPHRPAYR